MDFNHFYQLPIIDSHVHFVHVEWMPQVMGLMDEIRAVSANLVCIPNPDMTTHNQAALCYKHKYPQRLYVCGALDYASVMFDRTHASEILARQVLRLKNSGYDGLKLIEGKPNVRKLLPIPLDAEEYRGMWAALEEEAFPVILHVADPDEFWDPLGCPEWARQFGWDYSDGSYPAKEALYAEVEHVLERNPGLKIILAHFYFLSNDLQRAGDFLDSHPSVSFDLAPHLGMYDDFSRDPQRARDFFLHYQERILYGTDTDTRVLARNAEGLPFLRSIAWLIRSSLETVGPFELPGQPERHGMGLPQDVLSKIYRENFVRLFSTLPRPLAE